MARYRLQQSTNGTWWIERRTWWGYWSPLDVRTGLDRAVARLRELVGLEP
jgi:hypothetical protein